MTGPWHVTIRYSILLMAFCLSATGVVLAQTPDSEVPPIEIACSLFPGTPNGLCIAYCEAEDCDAFDSDSASCVALRDAFEQQTGSREFPCDAAPPNVIPTFAVFVEANRTSGIVGTNFQLTGNVLVSEFPVVDWQWELGDGRQLSGETIDVTFAAPGFFGFTVTATDDAGNTAETDFGIVVFDPSAQAPDVLGLPPLIGDVNGDGIVSLNRCPFGNEARRIPRGIL